MNWAERGFYHWCLNYSWINDGLPGELAEIARAARMNQRDFRKLWDRVGRCFTDEDGSYRNRRQEEERSYATTKSERATAAVLTRYGRTTEVPTTVLPRALTRADSDVDSDSKVNGNFDIPKGVIQSEYPLTLELLRTKDPATDEFFVRRLVTVTIQHCLSHPKFPEEKIGLLTDAVFARAVAESYATGPPNHGVGLLLKRVPNIMVTGAQHVRH